MCARGKTCMVTLIIIFLAAHLLGQVKITGKLLIPAAAGDKTYKAVITLTGAEIEIECSEKIFQLFNEFNTPKYRKIKVKITEIREIQVQENEMFIFPEDPFLQRYRNMFYLVWRFVSVFYFITESDMAVIFIMDNPADIGPAGEVLIKDINKKSCGKKG